MIRIQLEPELSIEPGHQWLVLSNRAEGQALATLLMGGLPLVKRGNQILVPHDKKVDARIVALIDELANARYQAPGLIQMTLVEAEE
jgi:hypothetical protein